MGSFGLSIGKAAMAGELVGFSLKSRPVYPVYKKACDKCVPGPFDSYGVSIAEFAVLNLSDETEVARLRSVVKESSVYQRRCPHEVKSTDSSSYCEVMKIQVDGYCFCCHGSLAEVLRGTSWSCPCCADLICNKDCFNHHIRGHHCVLLGATLKPIDFSLMGGEWCPLCRNVVSRCITPPNAFCLYTQMALCEEKFEKYAIKNTLCSGCLRWFTGEKKKSATGLYGLEAPPCVFQPQISLSDIGSLANYDECPQALLDLFKHDTFVEVKDSDMDSYIREVWERILLSRPDEMKAEQIPGAKTLAAIKTEIASFDRAKMSSHYLSKLTTTERLLSRIHSDLIRYAPSIASLLLKIS
ncbi:MAG: hypothetical protein Harvfovirus36_7 [Harvfovirus sp.]|uniref:Uncharacterized protein n=1 Tax=Harvfovirus sp. TaxID=2487768 RepID=A0A3G5A2M0_9VIRU|nr:MAG: hypothetical protein Harvfovirus36_7 [Harvfovirus sp.]